MGIGRVEPDRSGDLGFMNFLKPGQSYNAYVHAHARARSVGYDFWNIPKTMRSKAEMAKFLPNYLNYSNKRVTMLLRQN